MSLLDKHRIYEIPHGCTTLTAASITGLTPQKFEDMAAIEYSLARVIAESTEARAVGVVPKPLHELLMSRIKEIGKDEIQKKKIGRQSIVLPFTYRRRRTNIGSDVFSITAGAENANAGTTVSDVVYPNSSWDITVTVGPSDFASDLAALERYFLPGQYLFVEHLKSSGAPGARTAYMTAYKIIASVNASATSATVTIAANYSTAGWAALTEDQKAVFRPTFGVVQVGLNSVHDMESWCYNEAADDSHSLIVDWHQTSRYTQCHNDEYDRILSEIMSGKVNEFIRDFQYLPLAEQNKRQRLAYERKWMNTVFFGQRINELQSPETYTSLPQVTDPDDGTLYEYKANALGLRTLLAAESQVVDAQGGPLDLDLLFELSYLVKRHRGANGETVDVIDWMTDKDTAHIIHIAMIQYLKDNYGQTVTQFFSTGQVLDQTSGLVRFKYNKYDLPGLGFQVAIFVDEYFTDRVRSFGNGSGDAEGAVDFKSRGRSIWAIDWSDFNIGIVATNAAKREYRGEVYSNANSLFACVITPNTKHYELRSTTWTTQLGDAKRSFVYENFALDACPTLTLSACAPGYGG